MACKYAETELSVDDLPALNKVKKLAHRAAFDLIFQLDTMVNKQGKDWLNIHTICTSESLTAGMIMSTLVDIPWGGLHKYGGFAVYDTDAKRVFNKVAVDDVYTHRCAKEMAIGILKNSNATLAISVTGNAMPDAKDLSLLGEVFIGVAGYITSGSDTKIIYNTMMMNACGDNPIPAFRKTCKTWHKTLKKGVSGVWNPRSKTALISQEIRHYTAYKALDFCLQFVKANDLVVPEFLVERKTRNNIKGYKLLHTDTPNNKYDERLEEIHVGNSYNTSTPNRADTARYDNAGLSSLKSLSNKTPYSIITKDEYTRRRTVFTKPPTLTQKSKPVLLRSRSRSRSLNSKNITSA